MSIYYVDNVNGSDSNNGTSLGTAWATFAKTQVVGNIAAGDTVNFVDNKGTPYREAWGSKSGSAGNIITYQGYNGTCPVVLGSNEYSETVTDCKWTASSSAGSYYLTKDNGTAKSGNLPYPWVEPFAFATCSASNWTNFYADKLIRRAKGTVGSLTAGQFGWGNVDSLGFNTIYYRPDSGEDISTLHIEAAQGNGYTLYLSGKSYIKYKNFKIMVDNFRIVHNQSSCDNIIYQNIWAQIARYDIFYAATSSNFTFDSCIGSTQNVSDRSAFYTDGCTGSKFYNCIAYQSRVGFNTLTSGSSVHYNCTADNVAYCYSYANQTSMSAKNCIASNSTDKAFTLTSVSSQTNSNNCLYNNGGGGTSNYSSTNDVTGQSPAFVNRTDLNPSLYLTSSSPCVGAGTSLAGTIDADFDGVARPQGANYDIGAYEYSTNRYWANRSLDNLAATIGNWSAIDGGNQLILDGTPVPTSSDAVYFTDKATAVCKIGGSLSWGSLTKTGTSVNTIQSTSDGTQRSLTLASNATVTYMTFKDIAMDTANRINAKGTGNTNNGNNKGIVFKDIVTIS